jgi:hypothetical protein
MKSHTDNEKKSQSYVCEFPSLNDAKKYFGETADGHVKVKGNSEFIVQTFFVKHSAELTERLNDGKIHGVVPPDATNQIALDKDFIESAAYKLLLKDFYEIAKNYLIAETTEVKMTFTRDENDQVEIVIDSTQAQPGFNVSFAKHFKEGVTEVDYADILEGSSKIQSKKDKSTSFGGAGKGFAQLSQSLNKEGGRLLLESSSPEHPAVIRLQSPLYPIVKEAHDEIEEGIITILDSDEPEEEQSFSLGNALKAFNLKSVTHQQEEEDEYKLSPPKPYISLSIASPTVVSSNGSSATTPSAASPYDFDDSGLFSPIDLQLPSGDSSPSLIDSPRSDSGSESDSSHRAKEWNQAVGKTSQQATGRFNLLSPKRTSGIEEEPQPDATNKMKPGKQ